MLTREEAYEYIYDLANEDEIDRGGCLLIDKIFNQFEAQLKAKESDLERQDMIIKCLSMDLDSKEKLLKAKDEEIKVLGCRAYHAEGYISDLHNNPKDKKFYDKKLVLLLLCCFGT